MVFGPSFCFFVWGGRPGVPRPNNHTFSRHECFFGLGTPGLQKTTWQKNTSGSPGPIYLANFRSFGRVFRFLAHAPSVRGPDEEASGGSLGDSGSSTRRVVIGCVLKAPPCTASPTPANARELQHGLPRHDHRSTYRGRAFEARTLLNYPSAVLTRRWDIEKHIDQQNLMGP